VTYIKGPINYKNKKKVVKAARSAGDIVVLIVKSTQEASANHL
jgi:hypothetical protein